MSVSERAVQKSAEPQEAQAVQICLPMAEVLTSLEQGLGELVRKVGRMFIESVLESEVEQIAGPRSCRGQTRQAYRWGIEQTYGRGLPGTPILRMNLMANRCDRAYIRLLEPYLN